MAAWLTPFDSCFLSFMLMFSGIKRKETAVVYQLVYNNLHERQISDNMEATGVVCHQVLSNFGPSSMINKIRFYDPLY